MRSTNQINKKKHKNTSSRISLGQEQLAHTLNRMTLRRAVLRNLYDGNSVAPRTAGWNQVTPGEWMLA
jgi:hypothetical protein